MRKYTFSFMFVLLIIACQPSIEQEITPTVESTIIPTEIPTLRPTLTYTPEPTPFVCPDSNIPFRIDNINVYFEEGITQSDCNKFIGYITKTNEWAKSISQHITADIYIHKNTESVATADFNWGKTVSCNNYSDVNSVIKAWETGRGGIAYPPFKEHLSRVFLNVEYGKNYLPWLTSVIVHEIIHTVQHQYYAGRSICAGTLPSWWVEGQAEYYAETVIRDWGIQPDEVDLSPCYGIHLVNLPIKVNQCTYRMGTKSLALLSKKYGDKSFEVWREFAKGKSFEEAFYTVYEIHVSELSNLMDLFLECRKKRLETFCYSAVTTPTP